MADINYVITIRGIGGKSDSASSKPAHIAPTVEGDANGGLGGFVKGAKALAKAAPFAYAIRYADLAVTTHINRVELRTGNALLQEKISFQYDMGKRVAASSAAIIAGLATGNYIAAIGGAMSLVNIGVQQMIAQENINIARAVENVGLEQMRIRAGMSRRY